MGTFMYYGFIALHILIVKLKECAKSYLVYASSREPSVHKVDGAYTLNTPYELVCSVLSFIRVGF